jgi:hypothetical protein
MQYKVPQNIDMEDKIVGPFTMKQFIYLLVCGSIIYGWWNYLQSNYINFSLEFAIVAFPIGLLGFALALIKINDRPFEYFLLNVARFIASPKHRKWQDGFKEESVIFLNKNEKKKEEMVRDTGDLDQLAKRLEDHAATLQEKQTALTPQKSAAQIQQEGTKLNISVKDQPVENNQQPAVADNTQPVATVTQDQTEAGPAPATPKKKKFLGIFG